MMPGSGGGALAAGAAGLAVPLAAALPEEAAGLGAVPVAATGAALDAEVAAEVAEAAGWAMVGLAAVALVLAEGVVVAIGAVDAGAVVAEAVGGASKPISSAQK
jgi:hypothetical protein